MRYWTSVSTNSILNFGHPVLWNSQCELKRILTWHHQSKAYSQSLRRNVSHHMQVSQYELCFHQFVQQWVDINRILVPVFSFLLFGPWECNLVKCQLQFHFHKMLQKHLLKILIKNLPTLGAGIYVSHYWNQKWLHIFADIHVLYPTYGTEFQTWNGFFLLIKHSPGHGKYLRQRFKVKRFSARMEDEKKQSFSLVTRKLKLKLR